MLSVYGDYMDGGFLEKEDYHKIISEFVNTGELLNPDDLYMDIHYYMLFYFLFQFIKVPVTEKLT